VNNLKIDQFENLKMGRFHFVIEAYMGGMLNFQINKL